jgi:signal transduction histidine kinase
VAWGVANQGQPQTEPPLKLDERELILVRAAAARPSGFIVDDNRFAIRLPSEDPSAVLLVEADTLAAGKKVVNKKGAELEKAGQHLHRSLELADLRASLTRLERSEKLQRALFAISELADSDGGMQEALRRVHSIVGELMYAENFYIVRYDVERDSVRFLYFADVMDPGPPTDGTEIAMSSLEHSPTWYLLRDTKPLRGSTAELRAQVSGPLVVRGPDSKDWVGVPMLRGGQTCGAVVAQCYRQGNRFTDEDRALLEFVGSHILTMIERKQGKRDLEQRVRQRTVDLDRANQVLQCEIAERRRTERLHATLFQIAQLTNIDISETDFYRHVHTGISELINAENFYIALISKSGDSLDFAYYIDKTEQTRPSRPLGPGLSEYVLQHGSALLRQPQILELVEQGIVLLDAVGGGPVPACWLGVPLVAGEKNIGLIVVQSYDDSAAYGASDLELFSFVATQVANSLQRRRSTEALHQAYAQLKQRVNERTQELNSRNAELEVAYAKLKDAQDQAVQSEKLASIGQLAAGVAHEINNPIGYVNSNLGTLQGYLSKLLVAIEGFAEIVRKGDPAAVAAGEAISKRADIAFLASDAPQLIRESREGIDRVCKIIRDLKDFSRRDRSEAWVRADLNEGLTSTLNIVSNQLKYKAQIIKTFGDLPLIECLPSELNQVFLNILINAGQAIKQNGIITVTTDCSADKVWVAIGDDGDGIPEDVLPRIFDPFFTTKPVGTGTGLGLAISYGIVAKHHGNIEVTSVPDQGTLFRIELPIQQPR